ncbi:MAG: HD domain-containing protein [Candidatus Omnitrophota bacterium]|nr:MAG: HD domain-containing protein [Candidatus Omnitrophota bacterium]
MKRYKTIFSSFHAIYRLITASGNIKNFSAGICRIFKSAFGADRIVMVCKNVDSYGFMKVRLEDKRQHVKKGGQSILTSREKDILSQEKEITLGNRLIYTFNFVDTLGAIYIKRRSKKEAFNELERRWFLSLCEEVSIGLKIFILYREEKKIIIGYIKSLTKLLDQYVPTSYLHIKSIFRIIRTLGKALKLSESEIKSLEYAALLHDTGKIQLPSGILKKEKPLTDEEFKLIMKHPRKGVEMIKNLDILRPALPIILHHHERYDGKGYPSKLKKEQIPLGARILSVIDAFDAMYFGRPYKKRRRLKEIERELKKQTGKQFDPKVVETFLKIMQRKDMRKYLRSFL